MIDSYHIVESVIQASIGDGPVMQLLLICAIFKWSAARRHDERSEPAENNQLMNTYTDLT